MAELWQNDGRPLADPGRLQEAMARFYVVTAQQKGWLGVKLGSTPLQLRRRSVMQVVQHRQLQLPIVSIHDRLVQGERANGSGQRFERGDA